tara:strand:+ start:390 stop:593 length:204 start_codon:yes stop_codon:yes gene_type:complete
MSKDKPYANPVRKAKFKDGEQTAFLIPLAKVLTGAAVAGLTGYGYGAYKGIKDKVLNKKKKKKTPKK